MADSGLGIGVVSELTGVPAPTLRTWELRYGVPTPRRTDGGQRLYDPEVVPFIQLVQRALACGMRPGQALRMSAGELATLLHQAPQTSDWMAAAEALDPTALRRLFVRDYAALGALAFVTERAVPFLHALGEAWENHTLDVHHEHLATAMLASFVGERWREVAGSLSGRPLLLVTLPDEAHTLGIELAALVAVCLGRPVQLLGSVPPRVVKAAIQSLDPTHLLLSVSVTRGRGDLTPLDEVLAIAAEEGVPVLAGGAGMPARGGVAPIGNLGELSGHLA